MNFGRLSHLSYDIREEGETVVRLPLSQHKRNAVEVCVWACMCVCDWHRGCGRLRVRPAPPVAGAGKCQSAYDTDIIVSQNIHNAVGGFQFGPSPSLLPCVFETARPAPADEESAGTEITHGHHYLGMLCVVPRWSPPRLAATYDGLLLPRSYFSVLLGCIWYTMRKPR